MMFVWENGVKFMKLYHGSDVAVEKPKILQVDRRLDFGTGFYLTSSYEQAEKWAILTAKRRGTSHKVVTVFEADEQKMNLLNMLRFSKPTEEWLKFVANNRNVPDFRDLSDIVIGPVANDRTMPVIDL